MSVSDGSVNCTAVEDGVPKRPDPLAAICHSAFIEFVQVFFVLHQFVSRPSVPEIRIRGQYLVVPKFSNYRQRLVSLLADVEVHRLLVRSLDGHEDHRAPDTVQKHDDK